ncbi:1,2-dihydroxy-3-keto-5-methylthiopentene dioxygenase [Marasmius crinis-equi]|uniref:1,2-dihydroxy-3-keto-5-methylthiopentene dioxygenase n=1 Tax=Marasmius crinis-equi TaxID=585013 RepID=A0ABR3F7L3_9AGAR
MRSTTLRAFYRHATGDFSSPQDSGRPVAEDELCALGVKWWEIDGSHEEQMKRFRELSKDLGFADDGHEHFYDLRNPGGGMPHKPDMIHSTGHATVLHTIVLRHPHSDYRRRAICGPQRYRRKPGTDSEYIRLCIPRKYAVFYPTGSLWQSFNPADKQLASVIHGLYKSTERAESVMAFGENLDKHPARVEYVKAILGDV